MPTTTNFGWTTPADTDLVKDGASAIRTLANGVDTSFLDLKGGTTGQNLRKNSNTDLDFTWAGDATNTVIDVAGDLLYGSAADTLTRLPLGTAGQVLKVNSGATAPEWATAGAAAENFTLLNSGGTSLSGANVDVSFTAQNVLFIRIDGASATTDLALEIRPNNNTTNANYYYAGLTSTNGTITFGRINGNSNYFDFGRTFTNAGAITAYMFIYGANASGIKPVQYITYNTSSNASQTNQIQNGYFADSSTITSIRFSSSVSNFDGGAVYIYGA